MYRNLPATLAQINAVGCSTYAAELLEEASKPIIVPYKRQITFGSPTQAARLQRLLYELLYYYPKEKSKISMKLDGSILIIKLTNKEERRGRKGMKK